MPGCWAEYGDYLLYAPVPRLTVDACTAQQPGVPSPQAIQSVDVHLIRLHLERGLRPERANAAMQWAVSRSEDFVWLDPPVSLGKITILDVRDAKDPTEHIERVREVGVGGVVALPRHG